MPEINEAPMTVIGKATPRIDGPQKVSGKAMYSSDHRFPGMLFAVPVCATISNGSIDKLDVAAAGRMPGVRAVYHRANVGKLFRPVQRKDLTADGSIIDELRPPMEDDVVRYWGQYVAVAVAETFEQAKAAADAVRVTYTQEKPNVETKLEAEKKPEVESERGDAEKAFAGAAVKVDQTYVTPAETHNPIELHASVALWDGSAFTLYETTQAVANHRNVMAQILGVAKENVRIISKFLGSGFGGKLWPWTHSALAAAAARNLGAPVKLVVSRQMMFQTVGHRPRTQQRVRLGATAEGKLVSLQQDYLNHTSMLDDYKEECGEATAFMYSTPNLKVTSGLARRNIGTPTAMRGPGAVPGLYAIESAMDELAIALKMDPVELRLLNEPKIDEGLGVPFSSRHQVECLKTGAERFGWSKRTPEVGSMKRDGLTLGWGVAGCSWIAQRIPCTATVALRDDGTARVACGTQDIGTGTYTVLALIVAERLGLPIEKVEVVLGDTSLPMGPVSGGSMVTGSVIPAVLEATEKAIETLVSNAAKIHGLPFAGHKPDELYYDAGRVRLKSDAAAAGGIAFEEVLKKGNLSAISGSGKAEGTFGAEGKAKFSTHSFGAHFVEVTWQPEIARLRVSRVVSVIDGGRIINPLAGRNQIEGAVVMGIGMAMLEATEYDHRSGAPLNSNLADYIVAVNADVPKLEVHFLDYPDKALNAYGARGIGEIGLAGVAAAITGAVYHATGVRVRELPVRIEHLLA
jgi:xanthine dehydrogenase YagR molybdenum-binding subunit